MGFPVAATLVLASLSAMAAVTVDTGTVAVVIVAPSSPSPDMVETVTRMRGELLGAGFAVQTIDTATAEKAAERDGRSWPLPMAARHGAQAVIMLAGDAAPESLEVWAFDKTTGQSVGRKLPIQATSGRLPETVAIRAMELLRSSFLELNLTADGHRNKPTPPPPPPSPVVRVADSGRQTARPERIGVELGGAGLIGVGGIGLAVMPLFRIDVALGAWFALHATAAGLGTRPTVETLLGSAQVSQDFVTLAGSLRFRPGRRLRPFVTLGAGALHTSVEGRAAAAPNQGQDDGTWSFLLDAGLGASIPLRDRLYLSLAAHAQVAQPSPEVRFLGAAVATSARPNLVATLTLGAWL